MNWKHHLLELRNKWYLKKYQAAADFGVPIPVTYRDDTTNGLTRCVYDYLKFNGHYVNRINTQGQARIEKIQCFNKIIEKVRYTPGTTNKGTSDLIAIINGKHIAIEIKCGKTKDMMRRDQFKERERVETAGGVFIIVIDMQTFVDWYKTFTASTVLRMNESLKKTIKKQ